MVSKFFNQLSGFGRLFAVQFAILIFIALLGLILYVLEGA